MAADQGAAAAPAAVILAAGLGSRLRSAGGPPKPLTKVLGLSLAERTVCTLLGVGVRRFVVVLGYDARAIRPHFAEIARRREVEITCLEAENWELGNGASALAAESATEGMCFLLVMADHLVDPEIVTSLIKDPPAPGEICLAVDRNKSGIFDLDDVTRIRLDGTRLTDIGKNLPDWEAADTGVFLCTSGLFEGLRRAAAKDRHGLSDGVSELTRQGRARAVDVTGKWWLDVDTPDALRFAERLLIRQLAFKSRDGPVSRRLNRPVSRWLSRHIVRWPVTPTQISLVSAGLSFLAAGLFAAGGYPALAAGAVLAQLSSIIDGCDGEIARLKHAESAFGGWFDSVLDRYADAFLILGLTWHVMSEMGGALPLLVGAFALIGSFMSSYTADKYDGVMAKMMGARPYLRLGRDVRVFVIFIGALVDQPFATLAVVALAMNIDVVRRIVVCARAQG